TALFVFLVARLLADHHDRDLGFRSRFARIEFSEDSLRGVAIELTTPAMLDRFAKDRQRPVFRNKGRCALLQSEWHRSFLHSAWMQKCQALGLAFRGGLLLLFVFYVGRLRLGMRLRRSCLWTWLRWWRRRRSCMLRRCSLRLRRRLTLRFDRTGLGTLRLGALRLGLRLRLLTLGIWPLGLILTLEVRTLLAGVGALHWRSLWRGRGDGWIELALRPLVGVARGLGWVDWLRLRARLRLTVVRTDRKSVV